MTPPSLRTIADGVAHTLVVRTGLWSLFGLWRLLSRRRPADGGHASRGSVSGCGACLAWLPLSRRGAADGVARTQEVRTDSLSSAIVKDQRWRRGEFDSAEDTAWRCLEHNCGRLGVLLGPSAASRATYNDIDEHTGIQAALRVQPALARRLDEVSEPLRGGRAPSAVERSDVGSAGTVPGREEGVPRGPRGGPEVDGRGGWSTGSRRDPTRDPTNEKKGLRRTGTP